MLESYLYSILQPASKLSRAFWWRGRKRKKSKQLCLQNLKSASNSPGALHQLSCAISNHESEAEMSKNVSNNNEKHVKDQSANQHFTSTFLTQIFQFQRRCCKFSFLFPPNCQTATGSLLAGFVSKGFFKYLFAS